MEIGLDFSQMCGGQNSQYILIRFNAFKDSVMLMLDVKSDQSDY